MSSEIDWDIVGEAFDQGSPECNDCHYYFYQYWTDTGEDALAICLRRRQPCLRHDGLRIKMNKFLFAWALAFCVLAWLVIMTA